MQQLESASEPILLAEAVNIQDWLPTIVEPFQVRTGQHGQTLQINLPPDLPPLVSNHASLERILAELLNNACKYTNAGGEIVSPREGTRYVLDFDCGLYAIETIPSDLKGVTLVFNIYLVKIMSLVIAYSISRAIWLLSLVHPTRNQSIS